MARTEIWIDGEGKSFLSGQKWRFRCCDCGLTHDVCLVTDKDEPDLIGMAVRRNNRATAAARRKKQRERF